MNLIINGQPETHRAAHLAELLQRLEHAPRGVATAVNGHFVPLDQRAACVLAEGDRIEILAPMQGG